MVVEARVTRAIVGALREKDRSGSAIWRWIGEVHGAHSELTERNLYPTLYTLEAEGLIEGHWNEDGEIRRVYRLTSAGVDAAAAHQWPAIPRPVSTGIDDRMTWNFETPRSGGGRSAKASNVDGETEAAGSAGVATAAPTERGEAPEPTDSAEDRDAEPPHGDERWQIDAYLDELERALAIDDFRLRDVRNEIGDHLADMARYYRSMAVAADDALEAAVVGLGAPDELAGLINAAERTKPRLRTALEWGIGLAPAYFLVAYIVATSAIVVTAPLVLLAAQSVARAAGMALHTLDGGDLVATMYVLGIPLAVFMAARKSTTEVSLRARRSERSIFAMWAAGGLALLTPIALLTPLPMSPVVGGALALTPLAWVAGCRRAVTLRGDLISTRWSFVAVAIVLAGMTVPGGSSWLYRGDGRPAAAPPAPAAAEQPDVTFHVVGDVDNPLWTISAIGIDETAWSSVQYEIWPARRAGFEIVPDAATAPVRTSTGPVAILTGLPRNRDWYLVVVGTGPDGGLRSLASTAIVGRMDACSTSILGWLLHRCG